MSDKLIEIDDNSSEFPFLQFALTLLSKDKGDKEYAPFKVKLFIASSFLYATDGARMLRTPSALPDGTYTPVKKTKKKLILSQIDLTDEDNNKVKLFEQLYNNAKSNIFSRWTIDYIGKKQTLTTLLFLMYKQQEISIDPQLISSLPEGLWTIDATNNTSPVIFTFRKNEADNLSGTERPTFFVMPFSIDTDVVASGSRSHPNDLIYPMVEEEEGEKE